MQRYKYVVIGAGISGLAFAEHTRSEDVLVLEANEEIGGYCRTVTKDGFIWDFSGHFFHFKRPDIENYLVSKMPPGSVSTVRKCTKVFWKGKLIDFPFQKNIHQLPQEDFIRCLHDLHFRAQKTPSNFREMLFAKFGRAISEFFLVPYNEKLYATDLNKLDVNAMGRFFPHANVDEIIRNFVAPENASYNDTFTYPHGGAIQYVNALASGIDKSSISLSEPVLHIDLERKIAKTPTREIGFEYLVSSAPLPALIRMCGVECSTQFSANKVLVFNLGFDRKGPAGVHWIYYPQRDLSFYRIGFYDNIIPSSRMSLYVEVGLPSTANFGDEDINAIRRQVLKDLADVGVRETQELVAHHSVIMDPAYVHMTAESNTAATAVKRKLASRGVYSIGRYGGWTYCSIEDNIIEARELAELLAW